MLGLRGNPLSKRTNSTSNFVTPAPSKGETAMAPSTTAENGAEIIQSKYTLPQSKMNGNSHSGEKSSQSYSESRNETRTSETKTSTTVTSKTEERRKFSSDQQITVLRDTVIDLKRRFISEYHHVDELYIDGITIGGFLNYIEQERLTHMPHQGSKWDRVLKWAEFFALQVAGYEMAVSSFVPDSKLASKLIWAAARLLLELGHGNAQALEVTFGAFYKLGLSISFFLRNNTLLYANAHLRNEVGYAFRDLLSLVGEATIIYRHRIRDISSEPAMLNFNDLFGQQMEDFYGRKNHIIDAMWEYQLGGDASINIAKIRRWLKPQDKTVRDILRYRREALDNRAEYTCEWFQRYLLDFSRGSKDVLAIIGPEGCGKSILSGWTLERLQRPLAKKNFVTLSYSLHIDLPTESTPLAIAKSLALQLLETNVSDKNLFEKLSSAYNMATSRNEPSKKIEDALWDALEVGLETFDSSSDDLMIILDGIHEMGGDPQEIINKFESLSKKFKSVQTVIFARTFATTNTTTQIVEIKADHTHNDMEHVVEDLIEGLHSLKKQNDFKRENVVEQIVHHAQGNFLWAILALELLKKEQTYTAFMNALKEMPKTLHELIKKIVEGFDLQKPDTKLLLQWLLVAQRPLALPEVRCLYQVDLPKKTLVDRKSDIREDVHRACGALVQIQDGIVAFRHSAIRAYLGGMMAAKTFILPWGDSQHDLVMRLLLHCKLTLTKSYQPVFGVPNSFDADEIFKANALSEYSARYWIAHFQYSSLHQGGNTLQLSPEFKAIFPSSTEFVLLEWMLWEYQVSISQAVAWYSLALRIRESIHSANHDSVLQLLVICGHLHKRLSMTNEAAKYFYRASRIGQSILTQFNAVTISCTTTFLTITETIASTTRTEIVTQKEEMLKYIIIASKHQHGKTSEVVVRYYKILAELYVQIKEEQHAEECWEELREIIILRHGKGSEEEKEISKNLVIILKRDQKKEILVEYEKSIFETITAMDVWDIRRITMTFELAVSYEARGELFLAEELYIQLWRRLTEHCHSTHNTYGVEIHISVIDVALEYVRFLRRHHRHQEAASVLICIWNEYEECDFESETIILKLKIVGELMRAVSLLVLAVSVFKKCWSWFKFHSKHEHEVSCEVLISETVEEITTVTVNTTTTITTTTEVVMKEVFESTLAKKTVTKETITICRNLISLHMKLEHWSEAVEVMERSLILIWKVIISGTGTLALPRSFEMEAIDIAISLAICHYKMNHFHEAEEIYIRIYRACRISCRIDDERMVKAYSVLIKFYEEHKHWHKMIEIYHGLLVEYRAHLGSTHALTIKTLYILGSLCFEHGHGNFLEYYEEIVVVLNGKNQHCHKDAKDAMIILCRVYYEDGHWLRLKEVCRVLWESWMHHHKEHTFEVEFIETLYKRYIYVLEYHEHCEYEILRTLTIQYRDTCLKAFGVLSILTIKSMIELARICFKSEKHVHEAISIYEEVITKTTTTTTTTTTNTTTVTIDTATMTTIKESLSKGYIIVCSHGSASETTINKAIKVLIERLEYLKVKFGCAHSETLIILRELLILYKKLKTKEANEKIVRMLTETSVEIIIKEKTSTQLHEAAITLGGIFMSLELPEHGLDIITEMRRQIIVRKSTKKYGISLEGKVSKQSYIFIVTLERVLHGSLSIGYSEIMTEMLIETTLYEHYHLCLKSETDVTILLTHAARLREFLVARKRVDQVHIVDNQTFEIFYKKWGSSFTKTIAKETVQIFFIGLLIQLGVGAREIKFATAACAGSVETVKGLFKQDKFKAAYEIALCSFEYLNKLGAYHHLENIPYFFKLSALMARVEAPEKDKPVDPDLQKHMLALSQSIIREVFKALKESNINVLRLKIEDLNNIVGLLGAQKNYADLEWLLNSLWLSREVHKNWDRTMIISIGRLLAIAHSLAGHHSAAIKICEDICYNLRRVWGALGPETLAMEELLSQVYTAAGHFREAMAVHEDILRLIVEGDDGDDRTTDFVKPEIARRHVDLLRACYLRLKGWDKSPANYHDLVRDVLNMKEHKGNAAFKDCVAADKWNPKDDPGAVGLVPVQQEWRFLQPSGMHAVSEAESPTGGALNGKYLRPRMGMKRASSNWGLGFLHDLLGHHHGDEDDEGYAEGPQINYQNGGVVGNGYGNGRSLPKVRAR